MRLLKSIYNLKLPRPHPRPQPLLQPRTHILYTDICEKSIFSENSTNSVLRMRDSGCAYAGMKIKLTLSDAQLALFFVIRHDRSDIFIIFRENREILLRMRK